MTRRFLRTVCRGLIGALLFAQMAIAAYACPGLSSAVAMKMQMSSTGASDGGLDDGSMAPEGDQAVNCEDMAGAMGPSYANLCAEHCHYGQQSDHASTLTVPAALLTALYIAPLAPEPAVAPRSAAAATSALGAAFPPHTILHCCFRI